MAKSVEKRQHRQVTFDGRFGRWLLVAICGCGGSVATGGVSGDAGSTDSGPGSGDDATDASAARDAAPALDGAQPADAAVPNCGAHCVGCCQGMVCAVGNQDFACGSGGVVCSNCRNAGKSCQNGACR
jgi:hypothetical protein